MATHYDVAIIGGGPGGYNCAIRCAQLGLKTALIEKNERLGGTCLNVGCIPSKALLHSSHLYAEAKSSLSANGIVCKDIGLDLETMMARKNEAITSLGQGVAYLMKKHDIAVHHGSGRLRGQGQMEITDEAGGLSEIRARHVVIATGSEPMRLHGIDIDEERIVTNSGALSLSAVPRRMVIIGAGVIGLEMGSVWSRLGAQVIVTDFLDRILPGADAAIAEQAMRIFSRQGLEFRLGRKVTGVTKLKTTLKVMTSPASGDGETESLNANIVVVSVGRRANTEGLGLEHVGVNIDRNGAIRTRDLFAAAEGVWAIGDCIHGPMLAHKAEEDGVVLAEILAGGSGHIAYDLIPSVVYTHPEIAWVGRNEEDLKRDGIPYKSGSFPLMANSRARASHETDGLVKILAHAQSDKILGAHMIGSGVGEMISGVCVGMEFGASAEDIARTCFPHPTVSEAIKQASLNVDGRSTQM